MALRIQPSTYIERPCSPTVPWYTSVLQIVCRCATGVWKREFVSNITRGCNSPADNVVCLVDR